VIPSAGPGGPLVYSRGFARWRVIGPGRTGAYLALFTEIGFILFVLTLAGALGGHWLDLQLGIRFPIFLLAGLLLGMAAGALGIRRLINRFLATFKD
jgi:hypothetical protein